MDTWRGGGGNAAPQVKNPLHNIKTVMTGVEEMPLPNLIKFGVNLARVKSTENLYCAPKCDFAIHNI